LSLLIWKFESEILNATHNATFTAFRSPDSVAASKNLFQSTWVASEEYCLRVETDLQRTLLASWNQIAASGRTFGLKIPYFRRKSG